MLWSDRGWMTSPCVFCIPGSSDGGNQDDEQQRTLQHRLPPQIGISISISSVVKYRKAAEAASNRLFRKYDEEIPRSSQVLDCRQNFHPCRAIARSTISPIICV